MSNQSFAWLKYCAMLLSSYMMLIGLCGKKSSGKSATCSRLVSHHEFAALKLGAPMYVMLAAMGIEHDAVWGDKREEVIPWLGVSARHLFQSLGTEWGRSVDKDIWVNVLRHSREFRERLDSGKNVCIDNVRFENEFKFVKDYGGVIVHVSNPHVIDTHTSAHASEAIANSRELLSSAGIDHCITNDGILSDLHDDVDALMVTILGTQCH